MKKISKKDLIILIICFSIWLGTLISFFFVQNLVTLFLAIPHTFAFLGLFFLAYKYIPAPKVKKRTEKHLVEEQAKKDSMDEIIMWDMIDDD